MDGCATGAVAYARPYRCSSVVQAALDRETNHKGKSKEHLFALQQTQEMSRKRAKTTPVELDANANAGPVEPSFSFEKLPADIRRSVAPFLEWPASQLAVSKEWRRVVSTGARKQCRAATQEGKLCAREGKGLWRGCEVYCREPGPCVAWMADLMRSLERVWYVRVLRKDGAESELHAGFPRLSAWAAGGSWIKVSHSRPDDLERYDPDLFGYRLRPWSEATFGWKILVSSQQPQAAELVSREQATKLLCALVASAGFRTLTVSLETEVAAGIYRLANATDPGAYALQILDRDHNTVLPTAGWRLSPQNAKPYFTMDFS